MEVCNYRSPKWHSYQGKRKRYQATPNPNPNNYQGERGHHIAMEISEGHYNNLRESAKFRGSFSNNGRNSFNSKRRPPWDYRKNSCTFPAGKRRRKDFCMQDEYAKQDEYVNQDYDHEDYSRKRFKSPRSERGEASFSSCTDLVMVDSLKAVVDAEEIKAQVVSNERNLKVYESILPHLGMMRKGYEESECSDAKSSVSFLTWGAFYRDADCESMDIDSQYVDTDLTAKLYDIENSLASLNVKKDDIGLKCNQSFGSLCL